MSAPTKGLVLDDGEALCTDLLRALAGRRVVCRIARRSQRPQRGAASAPASLTTSILRADFAHLQVRALRRGAPRVS